MRSNWFFVTAAMAAALTSTAPLAQAQLLGGHGLVGGMIGGGGLNAGLQGDLDVTRAPAPALPAHRATTTVERTVPRVVSVVQTPGTVVVPNEVVRRRALIAEGVAVLPANEVDVYMDRQVTILSDELAGTGVQVERRGKSITLLMPSDVTFAFDKSTIQSRFYPVLNAVTRTINSYPATYVDVVGHTDAIGSDAYNQRLSERRAATVARYLTGHRADPARLYVEGMGKSEPIASNATIEGRAANRRVEITLTPLS